MTVIAGYIVHIGAVRIIYKSPSAIWAPWLSSHLRLTVLWLRLTILGLGLSILGLGLSILGSSVLWWWSLLGDYLITNRRWLLVLWWWSLLGDYLITNRLWLLVLWWWSLLGDYLITNRLLLVLSNHFIAYWLLHHVGIH